MKVGDEVVILIGKYKGKKAKITQIRFDSGARKGWFTVICEGETLLYAGEELG